VTSLLPPGWAWTTLGDIGTVVAGGTPSTADPSNFGGDIVWVTPADLSGYSAKHIAGGKRNLTQRGLDSCSATLLPKASVLMSSRAPVGYVAIAANPIATNQGFKNLILAAGIEPDYLYYYLKGNRPLLESYASGTTFMEVSARQFAKIPVALCSAVLQRRIVAKIEELFSQLDAGVEELKKAKAQLKRYRQSVLKAAFEGKLTEEWRRQRANRQEPIETAQELLARIREERKKALGRKYKEPLPLDTSDLSVLPEGWAWANAHQLTLFITDGEHITPERADSGVLLLSARNVLDGRLSLDKVDYVPEQVYERLCTRLRVTAGDVLLSCSGSVGRSCAAPVMPRFALVRSVAVLRPLFEMGNYMSYALRTPLLQSQIVEKKTQTAQANIFQGKIAALLFPVAPLEEQRTIVSEIESRLSIADAEEKAIEAALKQAARLRQSILKRAFEGRLVPQDPSDEPADRRLERIRTEKAKQAAGQPRGRGRRTATGGK